MPDAIVARPSRLAYAALLVALLTLPAIVGTGPIVLILGWLGLRTVNASDGRLSGRGAAIVALVLGLLGTVVGIAGFTALLLQRVRVDAERVGCADNLRLIGIAVNLAYEQSDARAEQRFYPRGALPHAELPPADRLSWHVQLLPFLGAGPQTAARWQGVYSRIRAARPWGASDDPGVRDLRIRSFLCPAQPGNLPSTHPGYTSYVGFAGIDPDAARLPIADPRAGMFGYERKVHRDDLAAGSSYTLLAAETTQDNGAWLTATQATLRGVDPSVVQNVGVGRPFGGCHPGIANTLRVDGSVEPIADAIAAGVFRSKVTLAEDDTE